VGAEVEKRKLEDQLAGREPKTKAAEVQTIRAASDSYIRSKEVQEIAAAGLRQYKLELGRFVTFCEGRGIFTFGRLDFAALIEYKATWPALYPASSTRFLVQARLSGFLKFCVNAGWLARVPGRLTPVKVTSAPTMPLSAEEYTNLLAAVPQELTNGTAARVRAIIQLMRRSGLAVRDASCLRTDQLLCSDEVYSVTTKRQKTGTHVSVPIPADVAQEILAAANKGAEYLFWEPRVSNAVTFAHKRGLEIAQCFQRADIQSEGHMVSHRLRDTFAVGLLEKGVPLEAVSKMLGHTNVRTTERHYAAWVKGRQDRLNKLVMDTWE